MSASPVLVGKARSLIEARYEDVEQDMRLPILYNETVLLDMDPYAVKTYNILQAMIAINAIDSERKDLVRIRAPGMYTAD